MKKIMVLLIFATGWALANPVDLLESALRDRLTVTEFVCKPLTTAMLGCDVSVTSPSSNHALRALKSTLEAVDGVFHLTVQVNATGLLARNGTVVAGKTNTGHISGVVQPPPRTYRASPTPSRSPNSFGSECTTYEHGNTFGVSCRSW